MSKIRERIEEETRNSEADRSRDWRDPDLGEFIIYAAPEVWLAGCEWASVAVLDRYPNDADLEELYAKWLVETGD